MRRGIVIFGEEILSLLMSFLAFILLLSNFFMLSRRANSDLLEERMQLIADNIADSIAKKYIDSQGNVDLKKLNVTLRGNIEVVVGNARFGKVAPDNVNVYSVSRLVFVNDQPSQLEVKVWP